MRRTAVLLAAVFAIVGIRPVSAQEFIPTPKWISSQAGDHIQAGLWLPCAADLVQNDCIESLQIKRAEDAVWQSLTFTKNPAFDVTTAKQHWRTVDSGGNETDPEWVDAWPGDWALPSGFALSDGNSAPNVFIAGIDGGLFITIGDAQGQVDLPAGSMWRVVLRSSVLPHFYSFVRSNAHDPSVRNLDQSHVEVIAVAAPSYRTYGHTCTQLQSDPSIKADSQTYRIEASLMKKVTPASGPADLVLGTNGWMCFTSFGFNRASGMIEIGVGTSHLDVDGKPIEGWLEAKISGAIAREWWGVDPKTAASAAQVQVSYEDGTTSVATTNAKYIAEKAWIELRSYGFHYSSPTLKVGLKPAPTAKPKASSSAARSTMCVKGKLKKKVSGAKCPSGWKKQSA